MKKTEEEIKQIRKDQIARAAHKKDSLILINELRHKLGIQTITLNNVVYGFMIKHPRDKMIRISAAHCHPKDKFNVVQGKLMVSIDLSTGGGMWIRKPNGIYGSARQFVKSLFEFECF